MRGKRREFSSLVGLTFASVENVKDYELRFTTVDGRKFRMYHEQDCCESVGLEDATPENWKEVITGTPILHAEESSQINEKAPESGTWTFYKLGTAKGWVDLRWYGESNGYYSESVDLVEELED